MRDRTILARDPATRRASVESVAQRNPIRAEVSMDALIVFLDSYGLAAACVVMLVKAMGVPIPIPGDVILLATAARAAEGKRPSCGSPLSRAGAVRCSSSSSLAVQVEISCTALDQSWG